LNKHKLTPWIALSLLAASAAAAQDPKVPFKKYQLDNGLEVILIQDKSVPLAVVDLWYHVGSGDETPGKSGFAHLFEHMMFQGTKNTGEDAHFRILQEIGSQDSNGSTNSNRTNYYEVVPSNQLEVALWLESERMGYLLDAITEESFANQREVVRNERRQNYDDVPYGRDRFAVHAALYPEGHPYRYLTIGLHEDLERASLADVKSFFRKWYVPANATLVLAGDFEVPEAERLLAKWFGTFPKTDRPARRQLTPEPITATKRVIVEDPFAKLRRVHYAWHSPALFAPGDAELDIIASALGNSGTGRLYKILVLEKQLARTVQVYQASTQMSSTFNVVVDLKDTADLAEVESILDEELEKVRTASVTAQEMRRAAVAFETSYVWGLESLLDRAEALQAYEHFLGDPERITWDLDRYRKTDLSTVQAVAAQVLPKGARAEVITMPVAEAPAAAQPAATAVEFKEEDSPPLLAFPAEPFRAERPAVGPARPLIPATIEKFPLPGGVEAYLVERHELPTVSFELVFEGGRVNDPQEKAGQADLCMALLDDGTAGLDKIAFEEALADLGSNIDASARDDQQSLAMRTLRKNLDATLDLWAATLLAPGLRDEDHQRNVQQALAALQQAKGAPRSVASRVYPAVYFGPHHPLGSIQTEASLQAVASGDCRVYVEDWLKPAGARLYVVGDIRRAEIEEKLAKRLQGWQGQPRPSVALEAPVRSDHRLFFVDVPGATQSMIYLFHLGPKRQAEDYFATTLMNGVLGGDFSSRINMNIREDKGWAYGAGSGYRFTRSFGTFRAAAAVRSDATKDSVLEILAEIKIMAGGKVEPEELDREKSAAILGLPGQFATGADVLESFQSLVYYGLPLDDYESFAQKVAVVTAEDIAVAARNNLLPEQLQVLVVGDAKTVLPGLREIVDDASFGAGGLVLIDADGKPLSAAARGD
jgi:zinc protease